MKGAPHESYYYTEKTPQIKGMIHSVRHLVDCKEAE